MSSRHFRTGVEPREQRLLEAMGSLSPAGLRAAREITRLGDRLPVWAGIVAVATLCAVRDRRPDPAVALLGSLAVGVAARAALAVALDRERPPEQLWHMHWSGPSFPSRHTTMATLGAGLVADTLAPTAGPLASAVRWGPSVGVGISRLVLGVHWPSDVLAGWAFGAAVLAATRSWRRRAGVAP